MNIWLLERRSAALVTIVHASMSKRLLFYFCHELAESVSLTFNFFTWPVNIHNLGFLKKSFSRGENSFCLFIIVFQNWHSCSSFSVLFIDIVLILLLVFLSLVYSESASIIVQLLLASNIQNNTVFTFLHRVLFLRILVDFTRANADLLLELGVVSVSGHATEKVSRTLVI